MFMLFGVLFSTPVSADWNERLHEDHIYFYVYDSSTNSSIAGATITITNTTDKKPVLMGVTDEHGWVNFTINDLPGNSTSKDENGSFILILWYNATVIINKDGYNEKSFKIKGNKNSQTLFYGVGLKSDYSSKAVSFYSQHKTAIMVGGGLFFLFVIVLGATKKSRRSF